MSPDRPPDRAAAPRGVTLVELLVVLALMATLMGLGISMYANLGKQGVFTASVGRVLSTINRVRNSSMTHPAAIQVNAGDPEKGQENSVRGIEYVPMFQSQCEPPPSGETDMAGALDRNGILPPGAAFREGVIGKALFLDSGGAVDCGDHPAYDATEGVSIDVWVHPLSSSGGTLVRRGDGLGLYLTRGQNGLGIRFELAFSTGGTGAPAAPGSGGIPPASTRPESTIVDIKKFDAREVAIPVGRWSRVVASYDRRDVVISLDLGRGPVEKFRTEERHPLAPTRKSRLYVGGGGGDGSSFRGGIDDIRIEGVLGENYEPFPPDVRVRAEKKSNRIRYLGGKLDPAWHTTAQTIVLEYGKRRREIVIGLEGNIVSK